MRNGFKAAVLGHASAASMKAPALAFNFAAPGASLGFGVKSPSLSR